MNQQASMQILESRIGSLEQQVNQLVAAFQPSTKAKLIFCNVPADDLGRAQQFYGALLGTGNFARSLTNQVEAYHQPISSDGIDLNLTQRFNANERTMTYWAVDDLDAMVAQLQSLGAKVVTAPQQMPVAPQALQYYIGNVQRLAPGQAVTDSIGRTAILLDPFGNPVGLVELAQHAQQHFQYGQFRVPLKSDQFLEHLTAVGAAQRLMK